MSMTFNDYEHDPNWYEKYTKELEDAKYNTMLKTAFDFVLEAKPKDIERLRRWLNKHRPENKGVCHAIG